MDVLLDKQVRMVACGKEHMACTVVHGWVPDEEAKACMACKKTFTTIRRRVGVASTGPLPLIVVGVANTGPPPPSLSYALILCFYDGH